MLQTTCCEGSSDMSVLQWCDLRAVKPDTPGISSETGKVRHGDCVETCEEAMRESPAIKHSKVEETHPCHA